MNIPAEEMNNIPIIEHNGMLPTSPAAIEYAVLLNTFQVDTKAYLAYSLEEAMQRKASLEKDTNVGWRIAVVLR